MQVSEPLVDSHLKWMSCLGTFTTGVFLIGVSTSIWTGHFVFRLFLFAPLSKIAHLAFHLGRVILPLVTVSFKALAAVHPPDQHGPWARWTAMRQQTGAGKRNLLLEQPSLHQKAVAVHVLKYNPQIWAIYTYVCICNAEHDVLMYVYLVKWLKQTNYHVYCLVYLFFLMKV